MLIKLIVVFSCKNHFIIVERFITNNIFRQMSEEELKVLVVLLSLKELNVCKAFFQLQGYSFFPFFWKKCRANPGKIFSLQTRLQISYIIIILKIFQIQLIII